MLLRACPPHGTYGGQITRDLVCFGITNEAFFPDDRYGKAVEIYEVVARQSLDSNLLKYSVKGYLLNAGLCHLCGSDAVAINNALEKYNVSEGFRSP